ncbi:MAG: ABC transporter permease subunit [Sarcina sp.]
MFRLLKYELKKLWNKTTKIAVGCLVVIISIFVIMGSYANSSIQVITESGDIVKGITAHRVLREESLDIEGTLDTQYLNNLVKEYNSSKQKEVFKDKPHMMKYRFVNYLINAIHYGDNMMSFYGDLDFDFLDSEEAFYDYYKKSLLNNRKEFNSLFKYTDEELKVIERKIEKLELLKVGYNKGLTNFIETFSAHFTLLLIVIVFVLGTVFSKDSPNGVDELLLSSKFGRRKIMNTKILAGNIISIFIYLIFILILLFIHGVFASLDGFTTSAQTYWVNCLSNINLGTGIFIMLFRGLLTVLFIANLVMFISIICRNSKLSVGASLITLILIIRGTYTADLNKLQVNPIFAATSLDGRLVNFEVYHFINDLMIPYTVVFMSLVLIYLAVIRTVTVLSYKKYAIK